MFCYILLKELQDLLKSLRFALTAVFTMILMIGSAMLFSDDFKGDMADYNRQVGENSERLRRSAVGNQALYALFSYRDQQIYRTPNHMRFLADGGTKDLPNAFSVDAFLLHSPQQLTRKNALLWRFRKLDLSFIVMAILSFAALALSFDSISGERSVQTLELMMAQPVSRHTIILAKFSGTLVCLSLVLFTGTLAHLTVLSITSVIDLTSELMFIMATAMLLSGLYLSLFILLGLLISSRCRESATSLVLCLLCWVLGVIVIPNLGGLLASTAVNLPNPEDVARQASKAYKETLAQYDARHPHPDNWIISGNWSPGEPLERAILVAEAKERVELDYVLRMVAQAQAGMDFTRISPAAAYRYGMEALAGSGLDSFTRFLYQARKYRQSLRGFLLAKYPAEPDHPYDKEIAQKAVSVRIAFEEIPQFRNQLSKPIEGLQEAIFDILIILLWSTVVFIAAYMAFLRCDVR